MRDKAVIGVALVFSLCAFSHSARATPETYDYWGWATQVKVLDSSVPLPVNFVECRCAGGREGAQFLGTLVVDLALPPQQRVLHFSAFDAPGGTIEAAVGHPDNRVVSQNTSQLGIGVPPPHWEMVTVKGNTGPLAEQGGRSIAMSLRWYGEPGAARQYPVDAQEVDLSTLTPRTSWRLTLTLRQGSVVYAVLLANVTAVKRRGSGGPDYDEDFSDGAAQGWTPRNGAWSATTGDLRNSANVSFTSSTIQGLALPDNFVVLTDVYLSWSASGNTAGVLFNYLDPGNFYEVRLNAQGVARFSQVRGGVRQTLITRTYPDAGAKRWHTIYVKRDGIQGSALRIEINGQLVFDAEFEPDPNPPQPLRGGSAGVFASWNLARFDNVLIGTPLTGVFGFKDHFDGDSGVLFPVQIGTWTIANGYMRSSTNQAVSTAVALNLGTGRVYGIAGRVYLEWSGPGNSGGFVYEYVDAQNYREVRVSRTVEGRPGEIILAERIKGVRREVLRRPRFQSTTDREVVLTVRRENNRTIVNDGGAFTNIQIRQAPITVPWTLGLFAAWNLVRFDDVILDRVDTQ
jgi:hypothetical protein